MTSSARLLKLGLDVDPATAATRLLKDYLFHRRSVPSLSDVRHLFDSVPSKDTVLWTAMVSAYSRSDQPTQSLQILSHMLRSHSNSLPNEYTFASAARAAASCHDRELARILHSQILARGFSSNVVVATSVVGMYSKCDDVVTARVVFDRMPERTAITWNSMVAGYATAGMGESALHLFYQMRCAEDGNIIDEFTVPSVLTGCAMIEDLRVGMQVHCYSTKAGFEEDDAVLNAVCSMYFRCREVGLAQEVMKGKQGDVLSKLMMVKGYAFNCRYQDVINSIDGVDFFRTVMADCSIVISVLVACAHLLLSKIGRQVHGFIVKFGFLGTCQPVGSRSVMIGSTLIDMYYKCSDVAEAGKVFDSLPEKDISHWNMMIIGSFNSGLIEKAQCFFDEMPEKNAISWTAMVSGYIRHGMPHNGLKLLRKFYRKSFVEEECCSIYTVFLDACSCLAAVDVGKQIHAQAIRTVSGSELNNIMLETALIDMYAKSTYVDYARKIFDQMEKRNLVSWTSMISAYASHGLAFEALQVFEELLRNNLKPNEVTFIAVLKACSHCGLVEDGMRYFNMMKERYRINPRSDHCACIVDMLARAGKLSEACSLIEGLIDSRKDQTIVHDFDPKDNGPMLGALLSGCRLHGNLELGKKVAQKVMENNHQSSDSYVSLSNFYAAAKEWDKVYEIRAEWMKTCSVQDPGYSRIPS